MTNWICYVGRCGVHCIQKSQRTYCTYWADIWVWWTQERVWEMWRRKSWSWRTISTCISEEKNNSDGEEAKERTKRRSRETSTLARAIGAHYNFARVECISSFCFCFWLNTHRNSNLAIEDFYFARFPQVKSWFFQGWASIFSGVLFWCILKKHYARLCSWFFLKVKFHWKIFVFVTIYAILLFVCVCSCLN